MILLNFSPTMWALKARGNPTQGTQNWQAEAMRQVLGASQQFLFSYQPSDGAHVVYQVLS